MKKALIYCANGYGVRTAYALNDNEFEIVALVDDKAEKWGKVLCGYKVISPDMIPQMDYDIIVIALGEYEDRIKQKLVEQYGVNSGCVIAFLPPVGDICWEEERIIMLKKCVETLKERGVSGDMAEVGVYRGDFCKYFNSYFPEKKLHLFDTFEGFDSSRDTIIDESDIARFTDTTVDLVLGKMQYPQNCIVHKGHFPDTAVGVDGSFALVSLDCDLYDPILAGLEFFYPRLSKGGYIFVHDFEELHFTGVKDAVYEFCDKNNVSFVPLTDKCMSVVITK